MSKVNSEHEEKEDDVVDHPGGKVEQLQAILSCSILDEKEAIKEPSKTLLRIKNQFPQKFLSKSTRRSKEVHEKILRFGKRSKEVEVADNPA